MLNDELRRKLSADIFNCFREKRQISLLTKTYPDIDVEDAYRIQERVVEMFKAEGRRVRGYKIGLTSKPMQELAGTTEPDYASILDHMFLSQDSVTPGSDWMDPLVEIEIAFVMKEPLEGPHVTVADVIRATDYVVPAIEIVDFRVARAPGMDVRDTIADLAAVGGVVLGSCPKPLSDIDVSNIRGDLLINGEVRERGSSAAVLGNPATAIAWLASKLSEFGISFRPGDVVLSGSFVRALPVKAGDRITGKFDSGFGDVSISFS